MGEGPHCLLHGHAPARQHPAAPSPGQRDELGLEREVDDVAHPQVAAQQVHRNRATGVAVHADRRGVHQALRVIESRDQVRGHGDALVAEPLRQPYDALVRALPIGIDHGEVLGPLVQQPVADGHAGTARAHERDAVADRVREGVLEGAAVAGLMRRLAERGKEVPRDLSVVGFDDIFGADFCNPPLTTLAERTEDAGARAVEALVRQIPYRPVDPPTRVLPTQLMVRSSTGPARN